MVSMNLKVSDYASRVLGVIKEKYGLKDKSAALERFADMYGDEFVDKKVSEKYLQKIMRIEEEEKRKHPNRRMTDKELDKLFGKG